MAPNLTTKRISDSIFACLENPAEIENFYVAIVKALTDPADPRFTGMMMEVISLAMARQLPEAVQKMYFIVIALFMAGYQIGKTDAEAVRSESRDVVAKDLRKEERN